MFLFLKLSSRFFSNKCGGYTTLASEAERIHYETWTWTVWRFNP